MARIRTIKPQLFLNESLAELPMAARLLYIGLFTQADRRGRLENRPKRIKAAIFPYDNVDVQDLLSKLQSAGFILCYSPNAVTELGEMKLIQILNFEKHQRITGSEAESESEYPAPKMEGSTLETTWKHSGNNLETPRTTGKEGKGKERKGEDNRTHDFSETITPEFISAEFKNNPLWHLPIDRELKVNHTKRNELFEAWISEVTTTEKFYDYKNIRDAKSHFVFWSKKKLANQAEEKQTVSILGKYDNRR